MGDAAELKKRGVAWGVTIWDQNWRPTPEMEAYLRRWILAPEICPTTKRPHLQSMFWFKERQYGTRVAEFVRPWRVECIKCLDRHWMYCQGPWTDGTKSKPYNENAIVGGEKYEKPGTSNFQGRAKRSAPVDWDGELTKIKTGRADEVDAELQIKHYGNIRAIEKDNPQRPPRLARGTKVCIWIYAETGSGKSTWVDDHYPIFHEKYHDSYWDGYQGEPVVYMDDVSKHTMQWAADPWFKHWWDERAFSANIKFGRAVIRPQVFICSSQHTLWDLYKSCTGWTQETLDALMRRSDHRHLIKYRGKPQKEGDEPETEVWCDGCAKCVYVPEPSGVSANYVP